ncbi:protein turtle B-like protein [Leptotrombidium deliense]|uniref:Protein turtle B-like protein n=1 Tax=Leptotrombidium deliense TaxID=299467 RepID=A0A443SIT4_9ACAR|nr:protein turtle B-like protein [Leptotrombidium deliense]
MSLNVTDNVAIIGGQALLPCNTTPAVHEDSVVLVIWYREDMGIPIYTIDARSTHVTKAKHFSKHFTDNRAMFNITFPFSFLRINPVIESDEGEYRCRVDFRRGPTVNRISVLKVIVPISEISIFDDNGEIMETAGPYNEDTSVSLTCKVKGGRPPPAVTWWKNLYLLDDSYFFKQHFTINVLTISQLKAQDLMSTLTCQASNSNLMSPVIKSIKVDVNRK